MQISDAIEIELKYYKQKIEQNEIINIKARNCFKIEEITLSILKCTYSFNYCRTRDKNINKGMSKSNCPRCSKEETWEHVL